MSLVRNYDISDVTRAGLLVLDRRPSPRALSLSPILNTEITWDESLALNAKPGQLIQMQLEADLTWLGRLLSFAYKPPQIWLEVKLRNGNTNEYRLISENAKLGFILSPLILDVHSGLQLFGVVNPSQNDQREVVSVKVVQVPRLRFAYKKQIKVRFSYVVGR